MKVSECKLVAIGAIECMLDEEEDKEERAKYKATLVWLESIPEVEVDADSKAVMDNLMGRDKDFEPEQTRESFAGVDIKASAEEVTKAGEAHAESEA